MKIARMTTIGLLMLGLAAVPDLQAGSWELLGERLVKFSADRDVIRVTANEGTFKKIKLKVKRNGIEMIDLKVHFGNGEVEDIKLRGFIKAGGQTRVIDLPGNKRIIKKVTLIYRTGGKKKGRALVQLLGKH